MLQRGSGDHSSGGHSSESVRPGRGFFDAPWWRLLLWAAVLIAVLVILEWLGILG